MTTADQSFIRLSARRHGLLRRASLWDAGDYLLSISGTMFSERYRRFYYGDIKGIVVQKGPRMGSIGAMLLAVWFTIPLFATAALSPTARLPVRLIFLLPLGWLAWLIYVNLARSCRVFLFTAVSSEEIPALFRQARTAKVLPKILSKIAEAQGAMAAEQTDFIPQTNERPELPALPPSRQILYSVTSFSLLFLASAAFAYWYRNAPWTPGSLLPAKTILPLLNALEIASGVWAIFKLFRVRLMSSLRIFVFAGLALLAIRTYSLLMIISLLNQPGNVFGPTLTGGQVRYWIGTTDCALSLIVALGGLISLMLVWQETETRRSLSTL